MVVCRCRAAGPPWLRVRDRSEAERVAIHPPQAVSPPQFHLCLGTHGISNDWNDGLHFKVYDLHFKSLLNLILHTWADSEGQPGFDRSRTRHLFL